MFLRRCVRRKNGKQHTYWSLVESYRTAPGFGQRVVANLGELKLTEEDGWPSPLSWDSEVPGEPEWAIATVLRRAIAPTTPSLGKQSRQVTPLRVFFGQTAT